jgi:hypothetical protein
MRARLRPIFANRQLWFFARKTGRKCIQESPIGTLVGLTLIAFASDAIGPASQNLLKAGKAIGRTTDKEAFESTCRAASTTI